MSKPKKEKPKHRPPKKITFFVSSAVSLAMKEYQFARNELGYRQAYRLFTELFNLIMSVSFEQSDEVARMRGGTRAWNMFWTGYDHHRFVRDAILHARRVESWLTSPDGVAKGVRLETRFFLAESRDPFFEVTVKFNLRSGEQTDFCPTFTPGTVFPCCPKSRRR